jgi:hypothetical protein
VHHTILGLGGLGDGEGFVCPIARIGDAPLCFHFRGDRVDEICGGGLYVGADGVFDETVAPGRMQVSGALPVNSDVVAAAIVLERNMQRLVNIADPRKISALSVYPRASRLSTQGPSSRSISRSARTCLSVGTRRTSGRGHLAEKQISQRLSHDRLPLHKVQEKLDLRSSWC